MPNINTAQFTLTGMTAKRSLGERLNERWLSVMDFGATGDGVASDGGAIQAAFDYLYGPAEDPKGRDNSTDCPPIYFPPGNYKITQPLALNNAYGATLVGAGSRQTRLFWGGAEVEGEENYRDGVPVGGPISSLLESRSSYHVHVEGMTFDANDVQDVVYRAMRHTADAISNSSGTDGYFFDVHFTNAGTSGILFGGDKLGSEQMFVNCSFTNCQYGHILAQANALNHSFYNCYFANCEYGMQQTEGGSGVVSNCRFHNNSVFDIHHNQLSLRIENCNSTSQNFVSADGVIIGCRHTHASPGIFWTPSTPGGGGTATQKVSCKGNYSSNGYFYTNNEAGTLILMGNTFDNPDYLDEYLGLILWINGVDESP